MVSNAGSSLAGEPEMTCNTSEVAASRSRASVSSRVSLSTFVSLSPAGELRRRAAPWRATVLSRCVLTAFWPGLLRRLIITPRPGHIMVAIYGSAQKGVIAGGLRFALGHNQTLAQPKRQFARSSLLAS